MKARDTFSIRQMVELTGLSEFTIRGWETRYAAFCPRRGDTGRRRYHKEDIERALLLRELIKRGHKIGRVAGLSQHKLSELFKDSDHQVTDMSHGKVSAQVTQTLELMALQKWDELEALVKKVRPRSTPTLIHEFFLPLLEALSVKVNAGLVSIAQEHILSAFLKERIYAALMDLDRRTKPVKSASGARFVLAAPEGDFHETGLLLANLLLRSLGFNSLYLGPHTPHQDLAETVLRLNASHILLVTTVSKKFGARDEPLAYVSKVLKKVGSQTRVLLAGSQSPVAKVLGSRVIVLNPFSSLTEYLTHLDPAK